LERSKIGFGSKKIYISTITNFLKFHLISKEKQTNNEEYFKNTGHRWLGAGIMNTVGRGYAGI
jgi:hypothetical protein